MRVIHAKHWGLDHYTLCNVKIGKKTRVLQADWQKITCEHCLKENGMQIDSETQQPRKSDYELKREAEKKAEMLALFSQLFYVVKGVDPTPEEVEGMKTRIDERYDIIDSIT